MMKYVFMMMLFLSSVGLFSQNNPSSVPHATPGGYSIVAWDSLTGDVGIAVAARCPSIGALVPFAKAGVGAIATQGWSNASFGLKGLELLSKGMEPFAVVEALLQIDSDSSQRQIGIVDGRGRAYSFTGSNCQSWRGSIIGNGFVVQGSYLESEAVLKVMARTFEITPGILPERLLAALEAGDRMGGDRRGRQSAALFVVREKAGYAGYGDRFVDIRVDDDSLSVAELRRIYKVWERTFLLEAQMRTVASYGDERNYLAAEKERQRIVSELNAQLREKPDDPETLNRIAWMLAANNIDAMQALELAKRAVKLAPDKLNYLNTLAECHFRLKHYDEAIAIGSELVTRDPSNDTFWKQLQKFKEGKQNIGK